MAEHLMTARPDVNHDKHCERGQRLIRPRRWQSYEPYIRDNHRCHCHKRARETVGNIWPPALTSATRCSSCNQRPKRNRNIDLEARWVCPHCHVAWAKQGGAGWWIDDYGYLGEPVTTPELAGDRL